MVCFILIFSFLFEAMFTNLVPTNCVFIPLFTITALSYVYTYFKKGNVNYLIVCLILGLVYDIAFSDSVFVNTISFGIIGGIVILCYAYVKYNIYTSNIINIITLISYRIVSYVIVLSINYIQFNNRVFFSGIYNSLLINIVYGIILYFFIDVVNKFLQKKNI